MFPALTDSYMPTRPILTFIFFLSYSFTFYLFLAVLSLSLCGGSLSLWRVGATFCCSGWASHRIGFSCCKAQALGTQASGVVA